MFIEISYYCQRCGENKLIRIGNSDLPVEALMFNAEIKGFDCPACGMRITGIQPKDYKIIEG